MEVKTFEIEGLRLLTPRTFKDDRGFFVERYNQKTFAAAGLEIHFVQDNFSRSNHKVLRGLHFQHSPSQLKLVSCLRGKILDVAVDIRKNSPTFGKHQSVILAGDEPQWFLLPAGFAHGFVVLSEEGADVLYKVDSYYSPKTEMSLLWNDPDLGIEWKVKDPLLSPKDAQAQSWKSLKVNTPF